MTRVPEVNSNLQIHLKEGVADLSQGLPSDVLLSGSDSMDLIYVTSNVISIRRFLEWRK